MTMVYLITELFGLTAATVSLFANSFIIFVFLSKRIQSSENLRLPFYLSIADVGYSLSALVHLGYLATNWNDTYLDYNPYFVIISNCFLSSHVKLIITVSLSMAVDRALAIYRPAYYRKTSRTIYTNLVLSIGFAWFLFDFLFQLLTAEYKERPNCATMACFVDRTYLFYTSYSNSFCGLLIILMSGVVFFGLRKISTKNNRNPTPRKLTPIFQQANRITVGILFSSLFFVTVPSLLVTMYEEIAGVSLFSQIGPFYIASILVNGVSDSFVFLILNRKFIGIQLPQTSLMKTTTKVGSSHPPVDTVINEGNKI